MTRVPALNISLNRVRERQGTPRNVLRPLVAIAEAPYSRSGERSTETLAVLRAPRSPDPPHRRLATELEESEEILRSIARGTAWATGSEFFRSLVCHIASALRVRYALITECVDPPPDQGPVAVRTLAFWLGSDFGRNFEYALTGTPCEGVIGEADCMAILQIFAARAAAEVERRKAERAREALIAQLQEALATIKTLRGPIPVCAWCKRVRDDHGYWEQLELYVARHTEANFTHGICPECADKVTERFGPEE